MPFSFTMQKQSEQPNLDLAKCNVSVKRDTANKASLLSSYQFIRDGF